MVVVGPLFGTWPSQQAAGSFEKTPNNPYFLNNKITNLSNPICT